MDRKWQQMPWYDALLYITMVFMSIAVPIAWRWGLMAMTLLCIAAVVKMVATRHIGNSTIDASGRWAFAAIAAFWAAYFVSALMSKDQAQAWHIVGVHLSMLILPLVFMLCDTSLLTQHRIRILFATLTATLLVRFAVRVIIAIVNINNGTPINEIYDVGFEPLHHNYLSLYILTALSFLYGEIIRPRYERLLRLPLWMIFCIVAILVFYIVISGSRSGLIIFALLAAACVTHYALFMHKTKDALIALGIIAVLAFASYLALPSLYERLAETLAAVVSGSSSDVRPLMYRSGWEVGMRHPVFGMGIGDYWPAYQEQLAHNGFVYGFIHYFDSHNQYLETFMGMGFIGLTLQLCMMALPLVAAYMQRRNRLLMTLFTLVYAVSIFFEATLGRQMGVLFVTWWLCILIFATQKDDRQIS
ncbi:MAG: O-antigen ligase family protein [Bacteroidales bacterium]|nr:O-antigen ligase family protein [Bacteroidales bacterium]